MSTLSWVIGLFGSLAGIISLIFLIMDRLIPKPKLIFDHKWKLIKITNIARFHIYIIKIIGKKGYVADCSLEESIGRKRPHWQGKHAIDLAIPVGESKDICFRFNGGYDFKMCVKRKSLFKPNEFVIILAPN